MSFEVNHNKHVTQLHQSKRLQAILKHLQPVYSSNLKMGPRQHVHKTSCLRNVNSWMHHSQQLTLTTSINIEDTNQYHKHPSPNKTCHKYPWQHSVGLLCQQTNQLTQIIKQTFFTKSTEFKITFLYKFTSSSRSNAHYTENHLLIGNSTLQFAQLMVLRDYVTEQNKITRNTKTICKK